MAQNNFALKTAILRRFFSVALDYNKPFWLDGYHFKKMTTKGDISLNYEKCHLYLK